MAFRVQELLDDVKAEFSTLPVVRAVVLSGSKASQFTDERSDVDLYIYAETEPSKTWRAELARKFGEHASIGNDFWEHGDEWVATRNGVVVDIMYRTPAWIVAQLERVLDRHQASVGYSTCFVYNVLNSSVLYDRDDWFESLKGKARQPYPEALRRAIVAKNHPILRSTLSSYLHQISIALARQDMPSTNHRITAMLASYFDVLFAVNRVFHPGEKRLLDHVSAKCPRHPPAIRAQVEDLLSSVAVADHTVVLQRANALLDGLDALLTQEGLIASH